MNRQILAIILSYFYVLAYANTDSVLTPLLDNTNNPQEVVATLVYPKDFQSKYRETDFQYDPILRKNPHWENIKRWISELFRIPVKNLDSDWFAYLFKFFVFLLIAVVLYFIVKAFLGKEGHNIFQNNKDKIIPYGTQLEEKLHLLDFQKLIHEGKLNKDYRLLIRYYYLWILRKMSEKQMIQWDINKTNSDYLYEIQDNEFKKRFEENCYYYDYIWYGEFDIHESTFDEIESKFQETISLLR